MWLLCEISLHKIFLCKFFSIFPIFGSCSSFLLNERHTFCCFEFILFWRKPVKISGLTLCEVIMCRETNGLQFTISHKLDVQIPATGADICRTFLPTVATNDRWETKGPIADFDVVKFTLPGWLNGILLLKEQVNALSGGGYKRRRVCEGVRWTKAGVYTRLEKWFKD